MRNYIYYLANVNSKTMLNINSEELVYSENDLIKNGLEFVVLDKKTNIIKYVNNITDNVINYSCITDLILDLSKSYLNLRLENKNILLETIINDLLNNIVYGTLVLKKNKKTNEFSFVNINTILNVFNINIENILNLIHKESNKIKALLPFEQEFIDNLYININKCLNKFKNGFIIFDDGETVFCQIKDDKLDIGINSELFPNKILDKVKKYKFFSFTVRVITNQVYYETYFCEIYGFFVEFDINTIRMKNYNNIDLYKQFETRDYKIENNYVFCDLKENKYLVEI